MSKHGAGSVSGRSNTPWAIRRALPAMASVLLAIASWVPGAAAQDAAVEFVKRMSRDLIAANKTGSAPNFAAAFNQHAHIGAIGSYALGSYQTSLRPTEKDGYLAGMVRFMSRYAATESKKYQVSHIQVLGAGRRTASGIMVESKVFLTDGQSYDVQWLLQPSGTGFKIRDAKVQVLLGDYWMTPFLKDLFEKYIAENGSVQALVMALNR